MPSNAHLLRLRLTYLSSLTAVAAPRLRLKKLTIAYPRAFESFRTRAAVNRHSAQLISGGKSQECEDTMIMILADMTSTMGAGIHVSRSDEQWGSRVEEIM